MEQATLPLLSEDKPIKKKKYRNYKAKGSIHPKIVFDGIPCRCPECKSNAFQS